MKKLLLFTLLTTFSTFSQITEKQIDEVAEKTLKAFNVPGIAVAVVKDGKIIHSKGYGVKSILKNDKVDGNTLFGVASNSKAFTTAAIAMLVDKGKMNWDDKVIKYLPNFKMYNNYVTTEFTVRDLVTHRSGLGLGAGDLMIWPDGSNFKPKDIIENIQFLKPVSSFRTKYDYDNLLYIIAGEVIAKVSGLSWCDFIETKIMKPLEMNNSAATFLRLKDTTNIVDPHVPTDGNLKVISRYKNQTFDAAAGIYSSVNDMSKWMIMQLQGGKYGTTLQNKMFSEAQHNEMWQLQTIIPARTREPYFTKFSGYGLGWFIADVKGYKQLSHTGGLEGIVTQVTLIPELNLGIVVLTNQQSGSAFNAITNTIKNSYLNIPAIDYVDLLSKREQQSSTDADKVTTEVWETVKYSKTAVNSSVLGTYKDNWFGKITISVKNGKYIFKSERSPQLEGEIFHYKDNTFAIKWFNRSFNADALITFPKDFKNIKMKPISELTDFSYDFQDLDFNKVKK
jgi:CubicO group peptidase (beta-lactamase class C family)